MAWGAVIGAVSQTAGNWISAAQTWKTSKLNYKMMMEDADIIMREGRKESERIRVEADKFAKNQIMDFVSSGVTGEGTPTLLTKETYKFGEEEAEATLKRAKKQALDLGRQAKAAKRQGKAAIASAIFGSASSAANAYTSYQGQKNG